MDSPGPPPLPSESPSDPLPHSGFGIVSFAMSVACGFGFIAVFVAAELLYRSHPKLPYPGQMTVGWTGIGLVSIDGLAAAFGIANLFQKKRRKLYGILGLSFSLVSVVAAGARVTAGFMPAKHLGLM